MWGAFVQPAVIESPRKSTPIEPSLPRARNDSCIFRKRPSASFFSMAAEASGLAALGAAEGVWACASENDATTTSRDKRREDDFMENGVRSLSAALRRAVEHKS